MSSETPQPPRPGWINESEVDEMPEQDACIFIHLLALDFDFDGQLAAIRGLLERNRESERALAKAIDEAADAARQSTGIWHERSVDDHISLLHASVYQDAAHSMAATGMLAPFLETVFTQCFRGIGSKRESAATPGLQHARWQGVQEIQWNCHNFIEKGRVRTDLVQGILQLADAIGFRPRLPSDIDKVLSALFSYRNKMFHFGFEWPVEERTAFKKRLDDDTWPITWFSSATSGSEPWVFYLTDVFIDHCLETTDCVLTAFGEFIRHELFPNPPKIKEGQVSFL